MRCAPGHLPGRAGRGYQRPGSRRAAPSTGARPARQRPPSPRGTTAAEPDGLSARSATPGGADQRRGHRGERDDRGQCRRGQRLRGRRRGGGLLGALLVQGRAVETGELAEHRHRGAVVAARHAAGAGAVGAPDAPAGHVEARRGRRPRRPRRPTAPSAGRRCPSRRCSLARSRRRRSRRSRPAPRPGAAWAAGPRRPAASAGGAAGGGGASGGTFTCGSGGRPTDGRFGTAGTRVLTTNGVGALSGGRSHGAADRRPRVAPSTR